MKLGLLHPEKITQTIQGHISTPDGRIWFKQYSTTQEGYLGHKTLKKMWAAGEFPMESPKVSARLWVGPFPLLIQITPYSTSTLIPLLQNILALGSAIFEHITAHRPRSFNHGTDTKRAPKISNRESNQKRNATSAQENNTPAILSNALIIFDRPTPARMWIEKWGSDGPWHFWVTSEELLSNIASAAHGRTKSQLRTLHTA